MSLYIGQKLKCISDNWDLAPNRPFRGNLPKFGAIYTIRGFSPGARKQLGQDFVWLFEITNPRVGSEETSFWVGNFTPIDDKKTDISIFQKMLTNERVDA